MSEVYDRYVDTAGNEHFTDVETGHHVIRKSCGEQRMKFLCDSCEKYPCNDNTIKLMKYCPVYSPKPKPQTNADRIRNMTDEGLAEWFCTMCNFGDFCPYKDDCDTNGCGVLKWLKEEVKDE